MPGGSEWGNLPRICSSTGVGPVGSCRPDGKSRVTGDCHARFCGSPGVRFPRATRPGFVLTAEVGSLNAELGAVRTVTASAVATFYRATKHLLSGADTGLRAS